MNTKPSHANAIVQSFAAWRRKFLKNVIVGAEIDDSRNSQTEADRGALTAAIRDSFPKFERAYQTRDYWAYIVPDLQGNVKIFNIREGVVADVTTTSIANKKEDKQMGTFKEPTEKILGRIEPGQHKLTLSNPYTDASQSLLLACPTEDLKAGRLHDYSSIVENERSILAVFNTAVGRINAALNIKAMVELAPKDATELYGVPLSYFSDGDLIYRFTSGDKDDPAIIVFDWVGFRAYVAAQETASVANTKNANLTIGMDGKSNHGHRLAR